MPYALAQNPERQNMCVVPRARAAPRCSLGLAQWGAGNQSDSGRAARAPGTPYACPSGVTFRFKSAKKSSSSES
jgi:hypothetical protein